MKVIQLGEPVAQGSPGLPQDHIVVAQKLKVTSRAKVDHAKPIIDVSNLSKMHDIVIILVATAYHTDKQECSE